MDVQLFPPIDQRLRVREIPLELFNGRINSEAFYPHAKVMNLGLPEFEQAEKAFRQRKACAFHLRIWLGFPGNGSSQHSQVELF